MNNTDATTATRPDPQLPWTERSPIANSIRNLLCALHWKKAPSELRSPRNKETLANHEREIAAIVEPAFTTLKAELDMRHEAMLRAQAQQQRDSEGFTKTLTDIRAGIVKFWERNPGEQWGITSLLECAADGISRVRAALYSAGCHDPSLVYDMPSLANVVVNKLKELKARVFELNGEAIKREEKIVELRQTLRDSNEHAALTRETLIEIGMHVEGTAYNIPGLAQCVADGVNKLRMRVAEANANRPELTLGSLFNLGIGTNVVTAQAVIEEAAKAIENGRSQIQERTKSNVERTVQVKGMVDSLHSVGIGRFLGFDDCLVIAQGAAHEIVELRAKLADFEEMKADNAALREKVAHLESGGTEQWGGLKQEIARLRDELCTRDRATNAINEDRERLRREIKSLRDTESADMAKLRGQLAGYRPTERFSVADVGTFNDAADAATFCAGLIRDLRRTLQQVQHANTRINTELAEYHMKARGHATEVQAVKRQRDEARSLYHNLNQLSTERATALRELLCRVLGEDCNDISIPLLTHLTNLVRVFRDTQQCLENCHAVDDRNRAEIDRLKGELNVALGVNFKMPVMGLSFMSSVASGKFPSV